MEWVVHRKHTAMFGSGLVTVTAAEVFGFYQQSYRLCGDAISKLIPLSDEWDRSNTKGMQAR